MDTTAGEHISSLSSLSPTPTKSTAILSESGDEPLSANVVEVYLRIRPSSATQKPVHFSVSNDHTCIAIKNGGKIIFFQLMYYHWHVFFFLKEHTRNGKKLCKKFLKYLDRMLKGFNHLVFTYGVSRSGKTHTIVGEKGDPGLVQRLVEKLFTIDSITNRSYFVQIACAEIYCDKLGDLLAPEHINQVFFFFLFSFSLFVFLLKNGFLIGCLQSKWTRLQNRENGYKHSSILLEQAHKKNIYTLILFLMICCLTNTQ
ncbi:kinesin [Reticulomyxa filosa]|uniref:Kinesin n=1 Tax=Reticulomyxa filosa TaxID=46433 RepID=X6MLN6_RETFI|nr:kinesin [Reticulomyxa filosa]|eukprot:ETO14893.1 kinesin [Reticulomyxa filosa]